MDTNDDDFEFRGEAEKEASQAIDEIRPGEVDISDLARRGFRAKLRETLSGEEKLELHQRYEAGELSDEAAQILIGDAMTEIDRERVAFEDAKELDVSDVFQR